MIEALDYIESQARTTSYFDAHYQRKVVVGEYDAYRDYHVRGYATPQRQVENTLEVISNAIEWGSPFVLFWAFYNNESERLIHGGGFWLIDDQNEKQPVWHLHRYLLREVSQWRETRRLAGNVSVPTDAEWLQFFVSLQPALAEFREDQ